MEHRSCGAPVFGRHCDALRRHVAGRGFWAQSNQSSRRTSSNFCKPSSWWRSSRARPWSGSPCFSASQTYRGAKLSGCARLRGLGRSRPAWRSVSWSLPVDVAVAIAFRRARWRWLQLQPRGAGGGEGIAKFQFVRAGNDCVWPVHHSARAGGGGGVVPRDSVSDHQAGGPSALGVVGQLGAFWRHAFQHGRRSCRWSFWRSS